MRKNVKKLIDYDKKLKYDIHLEEYYRISEISDVTEKNEKCVKKDALYLYKKNKMLVFQTASFFLTVIILFSGILIAGAGAESHIEHSSGSFAGTARISNILEPIPAIEYDHEFVAAFGEGPGTPATDQSSMRIFKKYNMRFIDQHRDGMPNGCEVVSLTMVLSRYLPDITSHEIAENFMPRADLPTLNQGQGIYIAEDPAYYYIGNPAGRGFGIFAPGLTKTAQDTLDAYGINRTAVDISGSTEEELFSHISEGYPVIVFIPMRLQPVNWGTIASWHLSNSNWRLFRWPSPMHCAVLVDFTDTKVTLYDPTAGIVEYDRELFLQRWNELGPYPDNTRHAIVIK